ncbi:carbohydrate ABC transporter permease [Paenibacillus sp. LjRoot153]|uniref:carbohydrate ABC transporter permease n=1 Tax=Paenibacillus sp. LjRoot153 TaxID=3342270 RepID=UPI003ED1394D
MKNLPNRIMEILLWVVSLIIFIPLYFVLINSVKSATEVQAMTIKWPSSFHFDNYSEVFHTGDMLKAFMNSSIFSISSILLTSILAAMAAYIIVRRKSRINTSIFNLFLVGMIAPMNMVTTFKVMKALDFINTYHGLILLYTASFLPFTIFLYIGFISNLPADLDEAATVDGASPLRRFYSIIFPILKPVTVTGMVINFVNCWNDFIFPLYFVTQTQKWGTVLLLFQFIGAFRSSYELLFAGAMLIVIPTLIVYLIGQKHIIAGMTAGAIKG